MKIRNPTLIRGLTWIGARMIRLWMGTLRFETRSMGLDVDPHRPGLVGRFLYAFWHENLLLPAYAFGRPDIHVLISESTDGELIAQICQNLHFGVVRGSTTRGGVQALKQMLRVSREAHLAVTPDGPRGPRRQVQAGVVYLAARTGLPIVPTGMGYHRPWRANSWDRFALPRPGSFATNIFGSPIFVPRDVSKDGLEHYRVQVEQAIEHVSELAERWAETGCWPEEQSARSA